MRMSKARKGIRRRRRMRRISRRRRGIRSRSCER
jgi:hypothetical protein